MERKSKPLPIGAIIFVILLLGCVGAGYYALFHGTEPATPAVATTTTPTTTSRPTGKIGITWRMEPNGTDSAGNLQTKVIVAISGTEHDTGTYTGSCKEVIDGGFDGKGLLEGEVSAVQCWFAGAGDEIGIFQTTPGDERSGLSVMHGELGEATEGADSSAFRGKFKTLLSL